MVKPDLASCPKCGGKPYYNKFRRRVGMVCPHVIYKERVQCRRKSCRNATAWTRKEGKAPGAWNAKAGQ